MWVSKTRRYMAIRLMLLVLGTQILTLTTSPIALTDGLERMMRPLAKIHFPAHELAMLMSIALRFVPTLLEEADKTIARADGARRGFRKRQSAAPGQGHGAADGCPCS